jgi:predicted enzyme related to lactoylglutathione lyase
MSGSLVHFEILAADAERARGFWSSLLGWKFADDPLGIPYFMTDAGGGPTGGLYKSDAEQRGLIAYFAVPLLDAALEQVVELGGTVTNQGPIPEVGWYGHCTDTEGNRFGLFQSDPSAPAPAPDA